MTNLAIITNAARPLAQRAIAALTAANWQVETLAEGTDGEWQALIARLTAEGRSAQAIITAPPTNGAPDEPETTIASAWRGAKYALPIFAAAGQGVLITLAFAPQPNGQNPASDAAANSIRLLTAAALHDAQKSGIALRSNRLYVAEDASNTASEEAIRLLADPRSLFMAGTELTLSAHPAPAAASLHGKTILVTGATSGIGRSAAIELGRMGAFVAVGGRKMDLAEETLSLIREAGGHGMTVRLDVTDAAAWAAAGDTIVAETGALHGLVNNAGEAKNKPIADLTSDELDFLTSINCMGVRTGIEALAPIIAKSGGAILNIASVAGLRAGPTGSAYSASKAAMVGLGTAYAAKFAHDNTDVRVNNLLPGLIWSDSVADSLGEEGAAAFRRMIEPKTPLGRVGIPSDVATVIAYLLSDAAAGISGQTITVSGGLELCWP